MIRPIAAVALCLCVGLTACAQGAEPADVAGGTWQAHADLPYRVQEIYPALHQGRIWVAGGLSPDVAPNQDGVSDRVVIYDPLADRWSEGPSLPVPRHHPALVSTGAELLAFGGFERTDGGRWHSSRDVLRLDADGAGWTRVARMPAPQSETVAAFIDGAIYLATGRTPRGAANANWPDHADTARLLVFDPATLTFTDGPAAPVALNSAAGAVISGRLHVVGGRTVNGGNKTAHQVFDPASGRWTEWPALPKAQGGLAAAAVGGALYAFGGEYFSATGGGVYAQSWAYAPGKKRWFALPDMPVPRHGLGAVSVDGHIFVIAGATRAGGAGTSARLSSFRPG